MQGMSDSLWSLTLGEIQEQRDLVNRGYNSPYREEVVANDDPPKEEPESD